MIDKKFENCYTTNIITLKVFQTINKRNENENENQPANQYVIYCYTIYDIFLWQDISNYVFF